MDTCLYTILRNKIFLAINTLEIENEELITVHSGSMWVTVRLTNYQFNILFKAGITPILDM